MNNKQWIDTEKQCSLLEAAINTDITDEFGLMLSDVEKSVNSEILKEEEDRSLEEMRIEKEKKEKVEKLRLKKGTDLKKKMEQDRLDRFLALKSLDEMVRYIFLYGYIHLFQYHHNCFRCGTLSKNVHVQLSFQWCTSQMEDTELGTQNILFL